jgi:hypothetical protein
MAPHATDEFLGQQFLDPLFLGPQFLGPHFRELDPMGPADSMGPTDSMGPWDCEAAGKYNKKELETLVPSATMVSAALTVRMATSPDFLFCDESPIGSPMGSRDSSKLHSPDIRIGLSVIGTLVGAC